MNFRQALFLLLILIILFPTVLMAQENDGVLTNADVFVTTQDYLKLRVGPGTLWEVITVLPPGTTLRATGRVSSWVQVLYQPDGADAPVHGWLYRNLLIWTGDINSLPLDGVEPEPFARIQRSTVTLRPDMLIYHNLIFGIGDRVQEPLPCEDVELTGHLGNGTYNWLQFWCDGDYYWVGSYYFFSRSTNSDYVFSYSTSGNNFHYRYGDLIIALKNAGVTIRRRTDWIASIWDQLGRGQQVSCASPPDILQPVPISTDDLAQYPGFTVPVQALSQAMTRTNDAITLFQTACNQNNTHPLVAAETVAAAQASVTEARNNLYIAQQFYYPLANRDPYAGGKNE